jgi:hypothetical protein
MNCRSDLPWGYTDPGRRVAAIRRRKTVKSLRPIISDIISSLS